MSRIRLAVVLATLFNLVTACALFHEPHGPRPGTFSGHVVSNAGNPLAGATVEVNGQPVVTDHKGFFRLTARPAPKYIVNISAPHHAPLSKIYTRENVGNKKWFLTETTLTTVDPTKPNDPGGLIVVRDTRPADWCKGSQALSTLPKIEVIGAPLTPKEQAALAARAGHIVCSPTMTLAFPPNALVDAAGNPPAGLVNVELATVDIRSPDAMPGDTTTRMRERQMGTMRTFGAGYVTVTANGKTYQPDQKRNMRAMLTIPLDSVMRKQVKTFAKTVLLLLYDEKEGIWKEEGAGALSKDEAAYEAPLAHFSFYNMDVADVTHPGCVQIDSRLVDGGFWFGIDWGMFSMMNPNPATGSGGTWSPLHDYAYQSGTSDPMTPTVGNSVCTPPTDITSDGGMLPVTDPLFCFIHAVPRVPSVQQFSGTPTPFIFRWHKPTQPAGGTPIEQVWYRVPVPQEHYDYMPGGNNPNNPNDPWDPPYSLPSTGATEPREKPGFYKACSGTQSFAGYSQGTTVIFADRATAESMPPLPTSVTLKNLYAYMGRTLPSGAFPATVAPTSSAEFRITRCQVTGTETCIPTYPNDPPYNATVLVDPATIQTAGGTQKIERTPDLTIDIRPWPAGTFYLRVTGHVNDPTFGPSGADTAPSIPIGPIPGVNDAPTAADLNGDLLVYGVGTGAQVLDQGTAATVTDPDSADFDTGTLTVSIVTNRTSAQDVLAIRNQGTGAGQIGVSGMNVTYGGTIFGTFTGGTMTNDLVVTFKANATPAAVQALVRNITYTNTDTTAPSTAARTVRFTLTDGDGVGGTSADNDVTVNYPRKLRIVNGYSPIGPDKWIVRLRVDNTNADDATELLKRDADPVLFPPCEPPAAGPMVDDMIPPDKTITIPAILSSTSYELYLGWGHWEQNCGGTQWQKWNSNNQGTEAFHYHNITIPNHKSGTWTVDIESTVGKLTLKDELNNQIKTGITLKDKPSDPTLMDLMPD